MIVYFINFLDEVGALVFDFGSHTVRAGYAGDEYPKVRSLNAIYLSNVNFIIVEIILNPIF